MIRYTEQLRNEFGWWLLDNMPDRALACFEDTPHRKKTANQFARENQDAIGFVTFRKHTGGHWFYFITNGKSESTMAFCCFLVFEKGLPAYYA